MSIFKENHLDQRLLKNLEKLCKRIFIEKIPQYSVDPEQLLKVIYELNPHLRRVLVLKYGLKLEHFLKSQYSMKTLKECADTLRTTQRNIKKDISEAINFLRINKKKYYFCKDLRNLAKQLTPIEELGLSLSAFNALKRNEINYVQQIESLSEEEIRNFKRIGEKLAKEIFEAIHH